ncbi:amidase domain-containing protein [Luethyella okanaganae]|uniref:Amidase domain-containing protein n=1 Tax=Luethyella okanaganae TaxID=69372 RepID=A0ABW1VIR9_9MICO
MRHRPPQKPPVPAVLESPATSPSRRPFRPSRRGRHLRRSVFEACTLLACGAVALSCAVATVGVGFGSDEGALSTGDSTVAEPARPPNTVTPAPSIAPSEKPVVETAPSVASGPVTGGTAMTVAGENLTGVSRVDVGGRPAELVEVSDTRLTVTVPAANEYAEGAVGVALFDEKGEEVPVDLNPSTTLAELHASAPLASALTFRYLPDERITSQTDYVLSHWSDYNSDEYSVIDDNDCVNFMSQALAARGWVMDGEWWYDPSTGQSSSAWVSSTAFRDYVAAHPERGTALSGGERALLKVGDIVQFDWDDSGDRDHTATVTRIDRTDAGIKVYVGGHTKDSDFWDVDEALANGGGSVYYWSLS